MWYRAAKRNLSEDLCRDTIDCLRWQPAKLVDEEEGPDRQATGSAAIASRRQRDEGSWRHSAHDDQNGGLSHDGRAWRQEQRRTRQLRRQEPHRCRLDEAGRNLQTGTNKVPALKNRFHGR